MSMGIVVKLPHCRCLWCCTIRVSLAQGRGAGNGEEGNAVALDPRERFQLCDGAVRVAEMQHSRQAKLHGQEAVSIRFTPFGRRDLLLHVLWHCSHVH